MTTPHCVSSTSTAIPTCPSSPAHVSTSQRASSSEVTTEHSRVRATTFPGHRLDFAVEEGAPLGPGEEV
eukprot:1735542-Rhodomonas_salina.1